MYLSLTLVDVFYRELEIAKKRLKLENLPFHQQDKVNFIQGSLIYRDKRFQGYDAAMIIEVIEHLDLNRLAALERVLFKSSHPKSHFYDRIYDGVGQAVSITAPLVIKLAIAAILYTVWHRKPMRRIVLQLITTTM